MNWWKKVPIEAQLKQIIHNQEALMALGQDILDAVTAEGTKIDSFIALVAQLEANNVVDPGTTQKIKDAIAGNEAKLDAAITANTPPPPPTP